MAGVVSTGLGVIGAIGEGISGQRAASFNAQALGNNADFALKQGAENQRRIRRSNAQFQGSQEAAIGASGLQLSGSALNVLSDSAIEGELMALDAKVSAENKAKGLRSQATIERMRGKQARRAGFINAGTTLINGASSGKLGKGIQGFVK